MATSYGCVHDGLIEAVNIMYNGATVLPVG